MAIRNVSQQDCLQVRSFKVLCAVNFQYVVEKDFSPPGSLLSYCLSQQQQGKKCLSLLRHCQYIHVPSGPGREFSSLCAHVRALENGRVSSQGGLLMSLGEAEEGTATKSRDWRIMRWSIETKGTELDCASARYSRCAQ